MQVKETVVENSGMLQGPLLKKHVIYKENGQRFTQADIKVGEFITLYAKRFKILDCDEFTRVIT